MSHLTARARKLSSTMFLERGDGEIKATIAGVYYPGSRGFKAHPMDRFAPPDDPAELDDVTAMDAAGNIIELTEEETERAEEKLLETLTD